MFATSVEESSIQFCNAQNAVVSRALQAENKLSDDSLQVFESPACLRVMRLMDDAPSLVLPNYHKGDKHKTPRISTETMADLLKGKYQQTLDYFLVVDCRYDYEYNGGHIKGAVCINRQEVLRRFYELNSKLKANIAVIFHCEFSVNRGPTSADFFRELDRASNTYPTLV